MSRAVMEQALQALESGLAYPTNHPVLQALRAALAEQNDDLTAAWMAGAAEERKRAEQAQPVACHVFNVTVSGSLHEWEPTTFAFALKDGKHALYTSPPAPQPLTDEDIHLITGHCGVSKHAAISIARAVEAEVLRRMGVQK